MQNVSFLILSTVISSTSHPILQMPLKSEVGEEEELSSGLPIFTSLLHAFLYIVWVALSSLSHSADIVAQKFHTRHILYSHINYITAKCEKFPAKDFALRKRSSNDATAPNDVIQFTLIHSLNISQRHTINTSYTLLLLSFCRRYIPHCCNRHSHRIFFVLPELSSDQKKRCYSCMGMTKMIFREHLVKFLCWKIFNTYAQRTRILFPTE